MLIKKYFLVIILLSIVATVCISEFLILHFLDSNLRQAEISIPVEIRLPIINLAAYDTLYKKGTFSGENKAAEEIKKEEENEKSVGEAKTETESKTREEAETETEETTSFHPPD